MSEYRLMQEIIDRSFAKTWAEAKLEWERITSHMWTSVGSSEKRAEEQVVAQSRRGRRRAETWPVT